MSMMNPPGSAITVFNVFLDSWKSTSLKFQQNFKTNFKILVIYYKLSRKDGFLPLKKMRMIKKPLSIFLKYDKHTEIVLTKVYYRM